MATIITAPGVANAIPESRSSQKPHFYIAIPSPDLAQDEAVVSHLVTLINDVYTIAEAGIFAPEYRRTNRGEVIKYLSSSSLALASTSTSSSQASTSDSPWHPPSRIIGCIRIQHLSPTQGEIGMLVAAPESRGTGLGRQLINFSEEYVKTEWGVRSMRLDLLVPTSFRHELKSWIQPWYERLGYQVVGKSDFAEAYPVIAKHVICETEYREFVKDL